MWRWHIWLSIYKNIHLIKTLLLAFLSSSSRRRLVPVTNSLFGNSYVHTVSCNSSVSVFLHLSHDNLEYCAAKVVSGHICWLPCSVNRNWAVGQKGNGQVLTLSLGKGDINFREPLHVKRSSVKVTWRHRDRKDTSHHSSSLNQQ